MAVILQFSFGLTFLKMITNGENGICNFLSSVYNSLQFDGYLKEYFALLIYIVIVFLKLINLSDVSALVLVFEWGRRE